MFLDISRLIVYLALAGLSVVLDFPRAAHATTLTLTGPIVNRAFNFSDTTADAVLGQPNFTGLDFGVSSTKFNRPENVSVDQIGRVYVGDYTNNRILIFHDLSDSIADTVLGQPNFDTAFVNNNGSGVSAVSATSLKNPGQVHVDAKGRIFISDGNNRILIFHDFSDAVADTVLGQPNFTAATGNNGGISANSFLDQAGIFVDDQGRLWVADQGNNRVLVFDNPLSGDTTADTVLGQPGFTTNTPSATANGFNSPSHLHYSTLDRRLLVSDHSNHRVLIFDYPLSGDTTADTALGQTNVASNTFNSGGISAYSFAFPIVHRDAAGKIYVSDVENHRVLIFHDLSDTRADTVLGQPNFASNTPDNGGRSATSMFRPVGLATDVEGRLYVGERTNIRVLIFSDTVIVSPSPIIGKGGRCLITMTFEASRYEGRLCFLRAIRDQLLRTTAGRRMVSIYYSFWIGT